MTIPGLAYSHVRILPLGGVGEVGRNLTVIQVDEDIILIDAGLMFPQHDMLGVDLVLPDVSWVVEHHAQVRGIVLTHGHEDHIGALPFIIRRMIDVPIYGTSLTLGILSNKLKEHHLTDKVTTVEVRHGDHIRLGALEVEYIRTTHSIPDSSALAVQTPYGCILHTGDFKIDYTPVHGMPPDLARFAELGSAGILCLLSDSTNAERPGITASERSVAPALEELYSTAPRRILVATFASNLSRIQQALDIAREHGRHCLVVGRSMLNNIAVARQRGMLDAPEEMFVPLKGYDRIPPHELLILCTGAQGEPMSALSRIASERHPIVSADPDDLVIISASPIPGNEQLVYRTINHLVRNGVTVATTPAHAVHASGHASQEELKLMLTLTKPQYFIPVHGEPRHLVAHAGIARSLGIPEDHIFVLENGTAVDLNASHTAVHRRFVDAGYVYVDGVNVETEAEAILRDRNHLANDGIIIVVMAVDPERGTLVSDIDLVAKGFMPEEPWKDILDGAREHLEKTIPSILDKSDRTTIANTVRDSLAQFIAKQTHRRPMILPMITEI